MTRAAPNLLVILGPTASGKTRLGVAAARHLGGEIISADSRQVYRGLDIGSGKDLAEYGEVPYHLIDLVVPGCEYHLFAFARDFTRAFREVSARDRLPVLVGGTGLYIDAVLRDYRLIAAPPDPARRRRLAELTTAQLRDRLTTLKPDQHNTTDLQDRDRLVRALEIAERANDPAGEPVDLPHLNARVFGLAWPREVLRQRITRRLEERLAHGLIEEVERLHDEGVRWETLELFGLEYRFVTHFLQGRLNRNDLFQRLNSAIHQFAKRQMTWFRRMERHGVSIHWLDGRADPLRELLARWAGEQR